MAFKQRSSGSFKMMGSSPAKAKTNPKISLGMGKEADANLSKKVNTTNPKAIKGKHYPDKATVQKLKTGPYVKGGQNAQTTKGFNNYTKTNAAGNRVDMMGNEHTAKARANRNAIGAPKKKGNVGYKAQTTTPKGFNTKGGKTATPGYSTTKAAKANTATGGDPKLEKLKAKRIANTKAGKIIKFGEGSNIIADGGLDSRGRNTWGDKVGKAKKVVKKGAKIAKKVVGKAGRFLGGKTLGVAGMLMATSSKADQPTKGKGKREYEGGKIDFTKKK